MGCLQVKSRPSKALRKHLDFLRAELRFRGVSDNLLTDMGQQKTKNDCLVYKDQTQYRDCVARVNKDYEELKARQKAEAK